MKKKLLFNLLISTQERKLIKMKQTKVINTTCMWFMHAFMHAFIVYACIYCLCMYLLFMHAFIVYDRD